MTDFPTIPLTPKHPPAISTELNIWWDYKNNGWMIPEIPPKKTWTFKLTKNISGYWIFSFPEYWIINESFCGGTELIIDEFFKDKTGKEPITGDEFDLTATSIKPDSFKSLWEHHSPDPNWTESNIYSCTQTTKFAWLCPMLQPLFGGLPLKLWIQY